MEKTKLLQPLSLTQLLAMLGYSNTRDKKNGKENDTKQGTLHSQLTSKWLHFQAKIGCAKIPMFTISHISQTKSMIRKLIDEKSFQFTGQTLPWDCEIQETGFLQSIFRTMRMDSSFQIIRLAKFCKNICHISTWPKS